MVEAGEDAALVVERMARETRNFAAMRAAEEEQSPRLADRPGDDAAMEAVVEVPQPVQAPAAADDTSFRRARMGVAVAFALLLVLVWIVQRRSAAERQGGGRWTK